jgi:hypothetical protein
LLGQTVRPDRIVLWIAHSDVATLPGRVLALDGLGFEIRTCDDLRSYKKLVPALEAFPDAFIVTADDDNQYPADGLERLLRGAEPDVISCIRAHRMTQSADGTLGPWASWELNVADEQAQQPSIDIMPIGIGGVLYPPRSLDPRVTDRAAFERLCANGDDLWFYWCARMAGTRHKKVGDRMILPLWPGSQEQSLWAVNAAGGNDRMIAALQAEFGPPQPYGAG